MKITLSILSFIVLLWVACPEIHGQETEDDLRQKRISVQMEKQALGTVVAYLMETYDIPIGFEESIFDREHSEYNFQTNLPSAGKAKLENETRTAKLKITVTKVYTAKEHPITVNVTDGAVGEVFDKIVGQMTNYKWEINDGVVNIFPIRGRDERFKELLDTRIEKFNLVKGRTVTEITTGIMLSKEFDGWLKKNKLHFNSGRSGSSILLEAQYGRILESELNFANVTFRELLNNITKVKKGGWSLKWYRHSATGDEYIDLDI